MTLDDLQTLLNETGLIHVDSDGTTYSIRDNSLANSQQTGTNLTALVWNDGVNHPDTYQSGLTSLQNAVNFINTGGGFTDCLTLAWVSVPYDQGH